MPANIILVDDHPVFRQGLRHLLSKEKDLIVVGEADDGEMAIELARRMRPDLAIMDINMPHLDGIEATRQIVNEAPEIKVVALSVHSGKQFVRDMIQAGASGYILKESIPEEMVAGIRTVLGGDVYLSRSISNILVSDYKTMAREFEPDPNEYAKPILQTKLYRPPTSANIVPRARLIAAMENGIHNPITTIVAPAGYGKSILASQWLEVSQLPGAWVSLHDGDNHLREFLRYVIEAIQKVVTGHKLKTKALVVGAKLPSARELAQSLLNDLEFCTEKFALVLDDYHLIHSEDIHQFLMELLIHPSPAMHLVLVARRDPPLPLTALRARGILTEIVLADLRFTATETKAYLERFLHITIADETAQIIEEKMEGWVTGLHLAALSLKDAADEQRLLIGLQKPSTFVQEYLIQEVLFKSSPAMRRHLLQTAVLNHFCASLCEALMSEAPDDPHAESRINGVDFIDWLVKGHFFIISLDTDGRWYRYHHLFQQLLQDQLNQYLRPEEVAELHSQASDWYAKNRFVEDAIGHAIAAGETAKAVRIIEQNRHTVMNQDKWYVFEKWLAMLPEVVIQRSPILLLVKAWLLYHHFYLSDIPKIIEAAEALVDDSQDVQSIKGEIAFFRGYFKYFQNDSTSALQHLANAREWVSGKHYEVRGQIEILHGLALQMRGQQDTALDELFTLLERPEWKENITRTRLQVTVVYIHIISGNLTQAAGANQQLYDVAAKNDYAYAKAWSVYLSGLIHFYRNELKEAIDCFSQAIEQKHILHTRAVIDSMIGLAIAYEGIREPDNATKSLRSLVGFFDEIDDPTGFLLARACQARLTIIQNQDVTFSEILRNAPPPAENMVWWLEIPSITYCRALIAQGSNQSLERSEAKLRELLELNQNNHNTCHSIQIYALLALVLKKQNRVKGALVLLKRALQLAAPGGFIRPFVEIGPLIAELLQQLLKQNEFREEINRILTAFKDVKIEIIPEAAAHPAGSAELPVRPSLPAQPLIEPLTNRELDVLGLLVKRPGNKEIAQELFISTETVKTHLANIYQKLAVSSRRQAVEKAKMLGIV